jgi:DNA-entry nuclease
MNIQGMLPIERDIADYIRDTGNHVLYRVTPCFEGIELVARGVHIEAYSVEDSGRGISINIFAYNVQPGIVIDYLTGDSWVE